MKTYKSIREQTSFGIVKARLHLGQSDSNFIQDSGRLPKEHDSKILSKGFETCICDTIFFEWIDSVDSD